MKFKVKKTLVFTVFAVVIFVFLGVLYARYITDLLTSEAQMHLSEVATQGAASVQRQVSRDFDILEVLADGMISDPQVPLADKIARIKKQADKFNLFRIGLVDCYGNATTSDGYEFSVSDREFFRSAIKGTRFLSDPIIDKVDGVTPGIVYAVPVYHNEEVVNVLFSGYELDKLTDRIDISFYHESGLAFIVDSDANVILHPIKERINANIVKIAEPLNKPAVVKQFKENLQNGNSGVSHIIMKSDDRFFAYAPIKGANDWFLFSSLSAASIFERPQKVIFLTVFMLTGISLLLALIALYIVMSKKKASEQIIKLAYYDPLTGAANVARFKLDAAALFHQFGGQKYTLLNFDVKQFRYLNNDLGYDAGNKLLMHITHCLTSVLNKNEVFARSGIDQFFLLFLSKNTKDETLEYIAHLRKLITAWEQPAGGYYSVKLAFGLYEVDDRNADIISCIEKSNIARKAAKSGFETDIAIYDSTMQRSIDSDTALEKSMPLALENGEFKLFIQPKYDLLTEKIIGGEALVRWIKPDGTVIMPNDFISLFEQTDAILKLDLYMLTQLCRFLRCQLDHGLRSVPISINQSRRYMYIPTYVDVIREKLRENGISPAMIELEITENLVYTDLDKLVSVLNALRQVGFRISLDDFGSGYSSLNVLKDLPVDTLKLDRFMLSETLSSEREKAIVANIISMARELHMSVIAEGVETREQVLFLRGCGCSAAQGYYYSKPIAAEKFEELLRSED